MRRIPWRTESTLDCRDSVPLRGGRPNGDLGWCGSRKASPSFRVPAVPATHGVLGELGGGSESHPNRRTCDRKASPSLVARRSTYAHRHRLDHPRRNRRWGIPEPLRKRSGEEAMNFDTPLPDGLAPSGKRRRWCGVARSPPSLDREGYHASLACPRGPAGEARATQRRGWKHPPADAREDRTLEVVLARRRMSLQKSTADVLAQRSGRLHFNRFGGVRGPAPSPLSSTRERERAGAKRHRRRIDAEAVT
jgi:hypothetical protein